MTEGSQYRPALSVGHAPADPKAVVLVLHGGREVSRDPVQARQLAVLRMLPFARQLARAGGKDLAVARLRYAVRGWNGDDQSPVADASWALGELRDRFGDRPVGLLGHSMGGRTALRVAGDPGVRSVVALAPWLPRGEPIDQLAGRSVLLVHGDGDRMTSPTGSAIVGDQLQAAGVKASVVSVTGDGHAMLRRAPLWHRLATGFLLYTLLDRRPEQSVDGPAANLLQQVIRGESRVTV